MGDVAGWQTDPFGRHELRYWDGSAWTAHVSDAGVTGSDEPIPPPAIGGGWKDKLKQAAQQGKELAEKGKQAMADQQAQRSAAAAADPNTERPAPPAAGGSPVDVADQLRKLAQLRDEGILSDEEFAIQKQRLLGL